MAGLILLLEFHNWTKAQAMQAYRFHLDVQYALNLEPVAQDLSLRTLERYRQLFEQDDLAQQVLHEVTTGLVELLGLKIDQPRLDSTHVFSDMAQLGRTRLMGVALKRFLTQVQRAESLGVELVGPVPGAAPVQRPDDLCLDDFVIDEKTEQVTCCPDGHAPLRSVPHPASGRTHTTMSAAHGERCAYRSQCPVQEASDGYHREHTAQQRRREQQTEVFRQRYRRRRGIESTNRGLKRRTGLGRLRVRGRPRVFQALYLKIAGWNILRASVCATMRKLVQAKAQTAILRVPAHVFTVPYAWKPLVHGRINALPAFHGPFPYCLGLPRAA
jgi:hypothetical protein